MPTKQAWTGGEIPWVPGVSSCARQGRCKNGRLLTAKAGATNPNKPQNATISELYRYLS